MRSMYGIFTYIYHKNQPNVGTYHTWIPWEPLAFESLHRSTVFPALSNSAFEISRILMSQQNDIKTKII